MRDCASCSHARPPGKQSESERPRSAHRSAPVGRFRLRQTCVERLAAAPRPAGPRQAASAKTFVVAETDRVAGYFSLTVGQIDTLDAPERIRKGMGQYPIPVVILARLAVCAQDQGRGIGCGLLQDAIRRTLLIAEQAGIRALLTHPPRRRSCALLHPLWLHRLTAARQTTAAPAQGRPPLGALSHGSPSPGFAPNRGGR